MGQDGKARRELAFPLGLGFLAHQGQAEKAEAG